LRQKLNFDSSLGRQIVTLASPPYPPFGRAIDCAADRILDLNVFFDPKEDVPYHVVFMLHQVFV